MAEEEKEEKDDSGLDLSNNSLPEEKGFTFLSSENEAEKSAHVQNQQILWDSALNFRIRLQKPLSISNQLPQPDTFQSFTKFDPKIKTAFQQSCQMISELLQQFISLDDTLNQQFSLFSSNYSSLPSFSSLHLSSLSLDDPSQKNSFPLTSDAVGAFFEEAFPQNLSFIEETIEKWNTRTQQITGQTALQGQKFKDINQGVVAQVASLLNESERLIRKTQLKRFDYPIMGKRKRKEETKEIVSDLQIMELDQPGKRGDHEGEKNAASIISGKQVEYDEEIMDDGDFYEQLLRDVVANGIDYNSSLQDQLILEKVQNARKKPKKSVDRRATKGRKIRYTIDPKLVNFVAPIPPLDDSFLIDELINGLFGGKGEKS